MKSDKQELIDNLTELERLTRTLAFGNVRNIAHDETDEAEAESMVLQLKGVKTKAAETILLLRKIISEKEFIQ